MKVFVKKREVMKKCNRVGVCGSQQPGVLLCVVVRVSFEGQVWGVVTDSHQEDDDGADGHHRGNQEEAEPVHRASDPAPVILLLWRERGGLLIYQPVTEVV